MVSAGCLALYVEWTKGKIKVEYLVQLLFWPGLYTLHLLYYFQFHLPTLNKEYLVVQLGLNYCFFILLTNLFYYFLIPVLLRKNGWYFLLITLVIIIGLPVLKHSFDLWLMQQFGEERIVLYGPDVHFGAFFMLRLIVYTSWAGIAVFLRLLVDWFKAERRQMELGNQQLQSELSFLRAQVNPHFLFNTLNNIYSLAYKKSDHTAEAVMKLSSMMRYMLYEANEEQVPLQKEVEQLHSFIALQKLRSKKQEIVHLQVEGGIKSHQVAPLLLIPLVENAFKHGDFLRSPVEIQLSASPGSLLFKVRNSLGRGESKETTGGVGLRNIRRRLTLLYPGRHSLQVLESEDAFEVTLTIEE